MALPASQRANKGFGFTPRQVTASGANPDRPLDHPPVVLEGKLVSEFDGAPVHGSACADGRAKCPAATGDVSGGE